MNAWLKSIRNRSKTKDWWKTLQAKLRGHFEYYGVSENYESIARYYNLTVKKVFIALLGWKCGFKKIGG